MVRGKKGQVAMEYLMIFALSAAMTLPLIFIFISQSQSLQTEVAQAQIEKMSYELESAAKEVYYLGAPSQKTIEISFPRGVNEIIFGDTYMEFDITLPEYSYVYTKDFPMNISGSLQSYSGIHYVVVRSTTTGVNITER